MTKLIRSFLAGVFLFALMGGVASAQGRIGTIDLRKVFDNYWKKKQAEAQLKDRQAEIQKELKSMVQELEKGKEEYGTMVRALDDGAISADEKDKRKSSAEKKLKELQEMQNNGV